MVVNVDVRYFEIFFSRRGQVKDDVLYEETGSLKGLRVNLPTRVAIGTSPTNVV